MNLESLLNLYARQQQLGKLELNSANQCSLIINNQSLITFEPSLDQEGFFVFSSLGSLPSEEEANLALMALSANLFGRETGRASIGYVETTKTLVLFEYFEENESLTFANFTERLNRFLKHLVYLILKFESKNYKSSEAKTDKKETFPTQIHKKIFYA